MHEPPGPVPRIFYSIDESERQNPKDWEMGM
jgi:hypothetical protein